MTARLIGAPKALERIDNLSHILSKVGRDMLGEVGEYMVQSVKINFSKERDPDGKKWRRLSKRTIKAKGHNRILFETGALNRSIQIVSLDEKSVSVGVTGTEVEKAITHQFGTERVPERPFLGFSDVRQDEVKINAIIVRHLRKGTEDVARS